jgi:hypothetical protein
MLAFGLGGAVGQPTVWPGPHLRIQLFLCALRGSDSAER